MGLVLGAALLGAFSVGQADAQQYGGPPNAGDRWERNQDRDSNRGWFARTNLEGRWREQGTYGREGLDFGSNDAYGPRRMLPSFLQIDQSRRQVRIADFRGRTLQTIQIGGRGRWFEDSDILTGQWHGGGLEVQRTTPQGARMTQTFSVQDRGRTLVIHTLIDNGRNGRDLEFDRVYQRA